MTGLVCTNANVFISRWKLHPDRREEFVALWRSVFEENEDAIKAMTNFVFYGWARDEDTIVSIESFRDEEQMAEFRKSDLFQSHLAKLVDCCSATTTFEFFAGFEMDRSIFEMYQPGISPFYPQNAHGVTIL